MGQLSQLVLLAVIVASYSIESTITMSIPDIPEEPSPSNFPIEFMKKLIASMTPEEINVLQQPIKLGDQEPHLGQRDGENDKTQCWRSPDKQNYYEVTASDDKERYIVVNFPGGGYQPVIHYVCDAKRGNHTCMPDQRDIHHGTHCCVQREALTYLYVIPEPARKFDRKHGTLFLKNQDEEYRLDFKRLIKKEVKLNSDCRCIEYKSPDDSPTCPNPESTHFRDNKK